MSSTESSRANDDELLFTRKPFLVRAGNLALRQPLGVAGALLVISIVFLAVFAEQLAPHDSELIDFSAMLTGPNEVYWLGTDQFGRDLWTRLMYGARTALFIGFICAFVGATSGLVLGVASAYFGGNIDLIIQRIIDVFMAFPLIIMALALVAVFGNELEYVILAITLPFIPDCARIVRSSALQIREVPYVDAARAMGFGHTRIILRHMLPNVMAPYLIILTSNIGQAILLEASLSYLGLGVQEPTPSWGLMLQGGAEEYAESAPWVAVFPGLAIAVAVFGFNLFGDAIRDVLDPRLRTR
ncbi:MAG: ABC transporter permease [Alphaproteobacteria bacterium]|jgi:peptide/nickel transport system permease protein|nr:ABC transporter permease [Alphaproteobacteria bacterium]|tara:strand:+ start:172 stop:1071 length:900 start_codon:yes stop_codon:yes gene_type:complete